MAGSRRRLKKTQPVVSMKKRKKPHTLASVPREITAGRPSIPEKLGVECAARCAPLSPSKPSPCACRTR